MFHFPSSFCLVEKGFTWVHKDTKTNENTKVCNHSVNYKLTVVSKTLFKSFKNSYIGRWSSSGCFGRFHLWYTYGSLLAHFKFIVGPTFGRQGTIYQKVALVYFRFGSLLAHLLHFKSSFSYLLAYLAHFGLTVGLLLGAGPYLPKGRHGRILVLAYF